MLSDIHSTDRESGDTQVKSGSKQEEPERIFSSCTPSLPNNLNCEMLQELAQALCGWAPWAGRYPALSPGLCHQLVAGLWKCSGFVSEGRHKRRYEDGCSGRHGLVQPHEVGKEKTDKPQNMIRLFPGADVALQLLTSWRGTTPCAAAGAGGHVLHVCKLSAPC